MQAWQSSLGRADRPGDRLDRQVAERIGAQFARPSRRTIFVGQRAALAGTAGRTARRSSTCRCRRSRARRSAGRPRGRGSPAARPSSRIRSSSTLIVVERTIESSTRSTRLPSSTSRSGVYLVCGLALAAVAAFDERAARVAIADQPFDARHAEPIGHRVGRRLAGVGHRHDDRVVVDRHAFPAAPAPRPAPCAPGRRCGRPACWPRWRSRSTRRSNAPAAGCRRTARSRTGRRRS